LSFDALYRRFGGITWYVQAVMNELWATEEALEDAHQVDQAVSNLVERRKLNFHDLDASQSVSARALLRAVAKEGCAKSPTSAAFLRAYGLKSASTVAGALKQLLSNELLYRTEDGYVIYDRLFGEYLRTL